MAVFVEVDDHTALSMGVEIYFILEELRNGMAYPSISKTIANPLSADTSPSPLLLRVTEV